MATLTSPTPGKGSSSKKHVMAIEQSIIGASPYHGVKLSLNSCQDFRVGFEDFEDLRIRLLNEPNRFGQQFSPSCKTRARMWCTKKDDAMTTFKNAL